MPIPDDATPFGASPEDMEAIEQAALDYMEGWFTGDAIRMRRALHPDLAKRCLCYDPETGEASGEFYGSKADQLVRLTAEGGESKWSDTPYDPEIGRKNFDIVVLEVFRDVAVARVWSRAYVEYLQLGNFGKAGWKIVNILYTHTRGQAPIDEWKRVDFDYWVPTAND